MRNALLALLLGFGIATGSLTLARASSWLMNGHDPQNTSFNSGEHFIGPQTVQRLRRAWSLPHATYVLATDKHVFATTPAHLLIIDAATGRTLRTLADTNPLAYASGRLLANAGTGGHNALVALNPVTGRVLWRAFIRVGSLMVAGNTVYTGYGCQNIASVCGVEASYAVDLHSGKVLWKHPGNFGGQPALIGGRLYQLWSGGYGSGYTAVYDPRSGQLLAKLPLIAQWLGTGSRVWANVFAEPNRAAYLAEIGASGKPTWKTHLGKPVGGSVLAYGTLYAASNRFHPGILAVNAANGRIKWVSEAASSPIAAANHILLANHNGDGPIVALDTRTGRTLAQLPGGRLATAIIAGGTVYVLDLNGLTALRP